MHIFRKYHFLQNIVKYIIYGLPWQPFFSFIASLMQILFLHSVRYSRRVNQAPMRQNVSLSWQQVNKIDNKVLIYLFIE